MEKISELLRCFEEVETTKEHNGYWCSIGRMLTIVILGSMCGLRNVSQIHQWSTNHRVKDFLEENFGILTIPCYFWILSLLKLIKPESLNLCFINWVEAIMPNKPPNSTVSLDGKTIRSTGKMGKYDKPLHIVSAHLANLGITLGQKTVEGKSNEIPAVRDLLNLLDISGCMVVADALNCQKETARVILNAGGDYLLSVKDNQKTLKEDIESYIQDTDLQKTMDSTSTLEKNGGRMEYRAAYTTNDIDWLPGKSEWEGIVCIGAINRRFTYKEETTNEWHYYISSRSLTAEELLKYVRLEWTVESMHWLLDVHFSEDFCRVEDSNVQQNLNIVRKIVLNSLRIYKNNLGSKQSFSKIMLDCLLDTNNIIAILNSI